MPRPAVVDGAYHARLATRSRPQTPTLQPITPERSLKVPDGAFAPSETFSPNLPAPINGRRRIKRWGRGECPVPPLLMGYTPSSLLPLAALAYPVLLGIKRSGRGECPVPPRLMGHTPSGSKYPVRLGRAAAG